MRGVFILGCLTAALVFLVPATAAAQPIRTGLVDGNFAGPQRDRALAQSRQAGAQVLRIDLVWPHVAPLQRPAGFGAEDPDSPGYSWGPFDETITAAVRAGFDPLVSIVWAPSWAEGSGPGRAATVRPDPVEFGKFARAAATRYSGTFVPNADPYAEPLPRVRNWMAWNEPNRDYFFMPQYENGRMVSPAWYRNMVNRFGRAVHSVHASNAVVAGGLAPLGRPGKPAPLAFMRNMLCINKNLKRTCDLRSNPIEFDVWSHHPYTSGGPTHRTPREADVALGDLPKMRKELRAAARLGHIRLTQPVKFWVTEFSWDTNPPDPRALGSVLHARWTSEAVFRMWQSGVSLVIWYRIQDDPLRVSPFQSGFFLANGRSKRSLKAFRFPVVAFARPNGIYVWGRTPFARRGTAIIEVKTGNRWRRLGKLQTNMNGMFARTYRTPLKKGHVRARFAGESSLPFSLTPVENRYVNPFGCGGGIACR